MNKEEFVKRRGEAAYEKKRQQNRDWNSKHPKEQKASYKVWAAANPDKVIAKRRESSRKGGKYYGRMLEHKRTGLPGERARIRTKHATQYHHFKQLIAPDSQIHHEWVPGTADFRGVALVEKDQHMHGFVDVIKILDGKITLFTEKEVKREEE